MSRSGVRVITSLQGSECGSKMAARCLQTFASRSMHNTRYGRLAQQFTTAGAYRKSSATGHGREGEGSQLLDPNPYKNRFRQCRHRSAPPGSPAHDCSPGRITPSSPHWRWPLNVVNTPQGSPTLISSQGCDHPEGITHSSCPSDISIVEIFYPLHTRKMSALTLITENDPKRKGDLFLSSAPGC